MYSKELDNYHQQPKNIQSKVYTLLEAYFWVYSNKDAATFVDSR